MAEIDPFELSSSEIPLDELVGVRAEAGHMADLLARLRAAVAAAPFQQRARALAGALVEGLPADVVGIFLEGVNGLVWGGGGERFVPKAGARVSLRQPGQSLRHRMHRLALRARNQGGPARQDPARSERAWQDFYVLPLQSGAGTSFIVLGRRARQFNDADVAALKAAQPIIADAMADLVAGKDGEPSRLLDSLAPDAAGSIVLAMDESVMLVDTNFVIQGINPSVTHIAGWGADVVGRRCLDVIRCHDATDIPFCGTTLCPLFEPHPASTASPVPRVIVQVDRPASLPALPVMMGSVRLAGASETESMTALLFHRDTGDTSQRESSFLSDLAHKLRNRFNSINGFVELVATDHANPVTAGQRQMLSYAHQSAQESLEYLENLLYLTRRDLGQVTLMMLVLPVRDLVEGIEQHLALEAGLAGVKLECLVSDPSPLARCDRTLCASR